MYNYTSQKSKLASEYAGLYLNVKKTKVMTTGKYKSIEMITISKSLINLSSCEL